MDGESSYESDISESWSLIDINLNEESPSAAEAFSELEKTCQPDSKREEIQGTDKTELEDFVRKCKESNKTDFHRISDSDSDASVKNQDLPNCNDTAGARGDSSPCKRSSDIEGLNDSSESIELLEVDDSDLGRFEVAFVGRYPAPISHISYHSDDEESLGERNGNESRNNNSTVIRRRRKRVHGTSEETVHSVNSENRSSVENNSTICSSDKKENRQPCEEISKTNGHPVYKHCRNNVANTILSLSVGIIVTGVACIAIGHFLGVQDAAETAVELSEALKKLQMENAALQSRLSNLNRALLTREMNSKIEPLNEPVNKAASKTPCAAPPTSRKTDINNAALSEIRSSLNSIEWLSKVQDFIHKTNKVTDTDHGIDFSGFGKYIHDQLQALNARHENGAKVLEETDKKISKVLHKIINRLSSSQDHIENLYERLIKLKNKLNHRIKKIFVESSKPKPRGRIPVTERDMQTMSWNRKGEMSDLSEEINTGDMYYMFPQPESYYEKESDLKDTDRMDFQPTNSTGVFEYKEKEEKVVKRPKKKLKHGNGKKEEKIHKKESWKKKMFKEKEVKEKKADKRRKREANKMHKIAKNPENSRKNRDKFDELKSKGNQNVFNQTIFQKKPHTKARRMDAMPKPKVNKLKSSKLGRVLLTKLHKKAHLKKKHSSQTCPGPECFNFTGNWVFKWAGGREEIRRNQALSDWQFDRAKARKEMRDDDDRENWQFKRALAREYNRNDARWRGKYAKYVGKDFFHEDFSWI